MSTQPPPDLAAHVLPDAHVNASQLRFDHWARIREAANRLRVEPDLGDQVSAEIEHHLNVLAPYEASFAFPGSATITDVRRLLASRDYDLLHDHMDRLEVLLSQLGDGAALMDDAFDLSLDVDDLVAEGRRRHYFTVLVADSLSHRQLRDIRRDMREARTTDDEFVFELLQVSSVEDAMAAVAANPQIQAVWIRVDLPLRSEHPLQLFRDRADLMLQVERAVGVHQHGPMLARALRDMRPELDLYLTIDAEGHLATAGDQSVFRRVFYRREHPSEMHMATLDGVRSRYRTPFFDALKKYAQRPIGNFHALPIARGNSVFNSEWIEDMAEFYGEHIFLAETSSTVGGLDSLLSPTGTLREAQDAAARAFGAKETYFATNGTSTSNKIVVQAVCRPGDIVLIDRDCHKSHHYGLVLSDAYPVYLDAYPLPKYGFYGGVPLRTIKEQLLAFKRAGRLDEVRMLLLTNCTFDGIVYHPMRVMQEVLAIKPDMVFLWDEAWFAFAQLHPTFRRRNAMWAASHLREMLDTNYYRRQYVEWREWFDTLDPDDDATWLDHPLLPDPDAAAVRVYATQSTHKSLSALRQGSMIHHWDEHFASDVAESFHEAYFTHTTTSPNYQILASLDLARRQVELEGYGRMSNALQMALVVRQQVAEDPLLNRYFHVLDPDDMIPEAYREAELTYTDKAGMSGPIEVMNAFYTNELVLDPTRLTLYVAETGVSGDAFKVDALMDRFGIQVNKTATNSVLLMTNIGTTWSAIDNLLAALREIARSLDERARESSPAELELFQTQVRQLRDEVPPLPDFSGFHEVFRPHPQTPEGDIRKAFFLAYPTANHAYIPLAEALTQIQAGRQLVSSKFVIPYPPGFPVLVPGQVISPEIVEFMLALAIDEIHGYRPELGLAVFTDEALASVR
jgi:arginine decarboxylase